MRDADRCRQSRTLVDALLDLARHVLAAAEESAARGHVEEGLVERQAFDEVRELAENLEDLRGDLAVALEARRDDHGLRAAPERLAHRHCGMHAETAHLVAGGGDDAAPAGAADDHRLARELRAVVLLDGRVERVHVDVQDRPVVVAQERLSMA